MHPTSSVLQLCVAVKEENRLAAVRTLIRCVVVQAGCRAWRSPSGEGWPPSGCLSGTSWRSWGTRPGDPSGGGWQAGEPFSGGTRCLDACTVRRGGPGVTAPVSIRLAPCLYRDQTIKIHHAPVSRRGVAPRGLAPKTFKPVRAAKQSREAWPFYVGWVLEGADQSAGTGPGVVLLRSAAWNVDGAGGGAARGDRHLGGCTAMVGAARVQDPGVGAAAGCAGRSYRSGGRGGGGAGGRWEHT